MEFQSERELGVDMDLEFVESMVQDEIPEQEMLVVQDELPQPNPEPEMGVAAAAAYDTSPPPLRQNPPILVESAQPSAPDMAQLCAMLAGMNANMQAMNANMEGINKQMDTNTNKMDGIKNNANGIKEEMKDEMKKMRGEMQQIGRGLQAGTAKIVAIARSEARTTAGKMVTPRAATNELRGSAPAGEDRVIRETCWARREKVTETVTRREKLNGGDGDVYGRTSGDRADRDAGGRGATTRGRGRGGRTHTHRDSEGQWG